MSVVIMGYKNARTIVDAVASVVTQECDAGFEIVVANSGPDGGTDAVRQAFPGVAVIDVEQRLMPGGARNLGIEHCTGAYIAFLEGDCVASPGWISSRLDAHRRGHSAVAGAVSHAGRARPWVVASLLIGYSARLPGYPPGVLPPRHVRAHGLSLSRQVLDVVGPFNDSLRIGEDSDYASRLNQAGFSVYFEPAACILHNEPQSTAALIRDHYRRGRRAAKYAAEIGARTERIGLMTMAWRTLRGTAGKLVAGIRFSGLPIHKVLLAVPWVAVGLGARRLGEWAEARARESDQAG